jgi:hypothetical protein
MPRTAPSRHPVASATSCRRTRLAEGSFAAIDECECGMLHLHLGPFSVRLAPEALSSLTETLGQAIATRAAHAHSLRAFSGTRTAPPWSGGDA